LNKTFTLLAVQSSYDMWFLYSEKQKLGYKNNILCQLTALEPASETVK